MKRLILVKESPVIQLGHMYEHIFCMRIDELFRRHNLFPLLDFTLYGKMYHGGVLVIEVEFYTTAAAKLAAEIRALPIDLNEDIMKRTLGLLIAELEVPMASKGYDALVGALNDLHARDWQLIDEMEMIDVRKIRRSLGVLYVADGNPLPARKLTASVSIDVDFMHNNRELQPLFTQLAKLISASWQDSVPSEFGFFSDSDKYTSTRKVESMINTFHIPRADDVDVDLEKVLNKCYMDIDVLRRAGAFKRYLAVLRDISYANHLDLAPSYERNYEDTLILMGAKGWQQIATEVNCELLLKHMRIEVQFNREKLAKIL